MDNSNFVDTVARLVSVVGGNDTEFILKNIELESQRSGIKPESAAYFLLWGVSVILKGGDGIVRDPSKG